MSVPVGTKVSPRGMYMESDVGAGKTVQVSVRTQALSRGQAVGWTKSPSLHITPNWPVTVPVDGSINKHKTG